MNEQTRAALPAAMSDAIVCGGRALEWPESLREQQEAALDAARVVAEALVRERERAERPPPPRWRRGATHVPLSPPSSLSPPGGDGGDGEAEDHATAVLDLMAGLVMDAFAGCLREVRACLRQVREWLPPDGGMFSRPSLATTHLVAEAAERMHRANRELEFVETLLNLTSPSRD